MVNNLILLVGAGVSQATNVESVMPGTEKVTDYVLNKEAPTQWPEIKNQINLIPENIRRFLTQIDRTIENFKDSKYVRKPWKSANYEDYYSIVREINQTAMNTLNANPVLLNFLESLDFPDTQLGSEESLKSFTFDVLSFVERVVKGLLERSVKKKMDCYARWQAEWELFVNLCNSDKYNEVNIFTLNHDTLLEKFLSRKSIPFEDGFREYAYGQLKIKAWDPVNYQSDCKNNIYKLHGSTNYYWESNKNISELPKPNALLKVQPDDQLQEPQDLATFLIGRNDKRDTYTRAHYFDYQYLLRHNLKEADKVIVSGYSFQDKAINEAIKNRWFGQGNHPLIVIDKEDNLSGNLFLNRNSDEVMITNSFFQDHKSVDEI